MKNFAWYCVLLVFILQPTLAHGSGGFSNGFVVSANHEAASSRALEPLPALNREQIEAQFENLEASVYELAADYTISHYFANELLDVLDYDPVRAFEYVRDEIEFEPYFGVLRGAHGTLGGRAGNAYDKSQLLQQLLEDMGYETRLAYATLDSDTARGLVERNLNTSIAGDDVRSLALAAGFSVEVRNRMRDRAHRDFSRLSPHFSKVKQTQGNVSFDLAQISDHVWVQVKLESDWEDLDPSDPGATVGERLASPQRYGAQFDAGLRHSVEIRVIAESLKDDSLHESNLLTKKLVLPDDVHSRVYLTFVPRNPSLGGTLTSAIADWTDYVPAIVVDGEIIRGDSVPGLRVSASESSEFFFGKSDTDLTGLYLEVAVQVPGRIESTSRTVLIDRVPAVARSSNNVDSDELAPLQFDGDRPVQFRAIHQILLSNGGGNPVVDVNSIGFAVGYVGRNMLGDDDLAEMSLDAVMWPAAMFRQAQLTVNERLLRDALNDQDDMQFYIGEPRVYVVSISASGSNDERPTESSIDLLHDPIYVATLADKNYSRVFERNVWHGVLQSSFETTLTELQGAVLPNDLETRVISASAQTTDNLRLIRSAQTAQIASVAPAALLADLDSGRAVVINDSDSDAEIQTWWSISSDGTTRAMLSPSLGGSRLWMDGLHGARNNRLPNAYAGKARTYDISSHMKKNAPKRRSGGGMEYQVTLHISIFNILGVTGILAWTLVILAFVASLYMLGYAVYTERQRRERGY